MKIHFTRDSICMGDDLYDNSRDYEFDENATKQDIMPIIKSKHFLATVVNNNVLWILYNTNGEKILSYYTLKDEIIYHTTKMTLSEICDDTYKLHFKYRCNPDYND